MGFGHTRFSSPNRSFQLVYLAQDLATAIAETIVRDRYEGGRDRALDEHARPPLQKAAIFAHELLAMLATLETDLRDLTRRYQRKRDRSRKRLGYSGRSVSGWPRPDCARLKEGQPPAPGSSGSGVFPSPAELIELLQVLERNPQFAGFAVVADRHRHTEGEAQSVAQRERVGVHRRLGVARLRGMRCGAWLRRSTSRTVRPFATISWATVSGSSSGSRARAWPAEMRPSASNCRESSGRPTSRSVLPTWLRVLPTTCAISACE